ncbi:MAG: hypothetical protein A3D64_02800 [Candidatus Wildermuthbacteria bacterium RIFCSPHIGHO2_02_FULL_49_9]|uniref:Uncharacterized protein n=2 Tax=Candidatus Wildermuthiibacteriota TaxID=1817923 RepID=A0A1G2R1A9_9BACT|nr:MAG: hypothetical protein A2672_02750 [Candidatus Wildermuthbacteria bacterium RIFCSPHIGHO2_01_FULL_49_22b]OHA70442.1 MAG: hypothetical protein A3D64_02800 [Candidatus Wildermuthbacteria bacterium RIFCSPHIGHO2_02_FULL_49_9]
MSDTQRFILLFVLVVVFGVAGSVLATSKDDIVFPVAELGNCQDEAECSAYCDDPANIDACLAFAEQHNLMPAEEIEKAKRFQSIGAQGPGGCTTERECEAYCENVNNIEECLAFAEQHGFMEEEELQEAQRVAAALRAGAQLPGGCTSKDACEAYCEDPGNMRECIAFAEAAGFIPPEELKEAKQVLKAIEAGVPPPNCRGKAQCDVYCQEPSHMEECVNFGIAAGLIPPEEAEQVRRILPLMKAGKMPGECQKGKEACEAYCSQDENIEECTTFFVEAGFMTAEEAEMFRKTGGKGPGDCRSKEECEAFCNSPQNQEVCFEFAKEHGLIPEEELRNIEEGTRQFRQGVEQAPPEIAQCLKETVGEEVLQKIQSGTLMPSRELGEHMRECFEEFMQKQQQMMEQRMQECLAMPCEQAFACLENMPTGGGPGEGPGKGEGPGEGEGPGGPSGFEQAIQAKIESCVQEFQPQESQGFPGEFGSPEEFHEGALPPGFEGESPEDIERMFQEQEEQRIRQQFEQEFEQQFQQEFEGQFQEQQQQQEAPAGGSVIDAFLYLLLPLLPK